jgi:hypothetical protein
MQARNDNTDFAGAMNIFEIPARDRTSIGGFVRQWGPYVLTALVVPGGIVIALLMLWSRWNQRRLAVQRAVRT